MEYRKSFFNKNVDYSYFMMSFEDGDIEESWSSLFAEVIIFNVVMASEPSSCFTKHLIKKKVKAGVDHHFVPEQCFLDTCVRNLLMIVLVQ